MSEGLDEDHEEVYRALTLAHLSETYSTKNEQRGTISAIGSLES